MASLLVVCMQFIRNPHLYIQERDDRVDIDMPYSAKVVSGHHALTEILSYFTTAKSKEQFLQAFNAEDALFDFLRNNSLVLPDDTAGILSKGICFEADVTPFEKAIPQEIVQEKYKSALVGIPVEFSTQQASSTTLGPRLIRAALNKKFPAHIGKDQYLLDFECNRQVKLGDLRACDMGNVAHYAQYDTPHELSTRLHYLLSRTVSAGILPIMLGGDHAISFFPIAFLSRHYQEIGVIQFDAHTDLYISPNRLMDHLTHANVFAHVSALPSVKSILQLGVRTLSGMPAGLKMKNDTKVTHISSYAIMNTDRVLIQEILRKDIPYYITIDLDVLDYAVAPEVNVPVIGGLSFYKLMGYYSFLLENYTIIGVDFVETVKGKNRFNYAAEAAARLILMTMFHCSGASETLQANAYEYQ